MTKVIAAVSVVILLSLSCVLIATGLVWGILIIAEVWRKIKE